MGESYPGWVDQRLGHRQRDGILSGHFRQGSVYRPAFMAYPQATLADWVRDDLPDLLWPLLLAATEGDNGIQRLVKLQGWLVANPLEGVGLVLDGRLTTLEDVPTEARPPIRSAVREGIEATGALPPGLSALLRLYDQPPGGWLLLDQSSDPGDDMPTADALDLLSGAIVSVLADEHLEALVKAVGFFWSVQTGTASLDAQTVELLKTYPEPGPSRPLADSVLRAMFGAERGRIYHLDPELQTRHRAWAAQFWRANWSLSGCIPEEIVSSDRGDEGDDPVGATPDAAGPSTLTDASHAEEDEWKIGLPNEAVETVERVVAAMNRFIDDVLADGHQPDLYNPAKHEVTCGLIMRAGRAATAVLRAPHCWSSEHSSWMIRLLAETEIVLAWLDQQGLELFNQYQDYGRGKQKLARRHMDDLAASMDEPPEELVRAMSLMDSKLKVAGGEEFINVSVAANFAGVTLREMAEQVNRRDLYRHLYQGASSYSHGEWWTVEDDAMQRCLNPLHRFHLIPSHDPPGATSTTLPYSIASMFEGLAEFGARLLAIDAGQETDAP